MHKLSEFRRLRSGRQVAFCRNCKKEVTVVLKPNALNHIYKRCENEGKVYALRSNGKPRKAPGKATGKALRIRTEMLARQACIDACGHKCMAAGKFGVECAARVAKGRVWPLLEWCHLQSRGMGGGDRLKFHPENCIALCGAHHKWFTNHDLTFRQFIEDLWPGRWDKLAELERLLPKGSGNDTKFWSEYYMEQGFTTKGRRGAA